MYFILIDEVSMVSQELLCEIDIVLRDVASCPNDWFGGVNIIFAGDFYQHKPVKQSALYSPIPCKPNKIYTQMECGKLWEANVDEPLTSVRADRSDAISIRSRTH